MTSVLSSDESIVDLTETPRDQKRSTNPLTGPRSNSSSGGGGGHSHRLDRFSTPTAGTDFSLASSAVSMDNTPTRVTRSGRPLMESAPHIPPQTGTGARANEARAAAPRTHTTTQRHRGASRAASRAAHRGSRAGPAPVEEVIDLADDEHDDPFAFLDRTRTQSSAAPPTAPVATTRAAPPTTTHATTQRARGSVPSVRTNRRENQAEAAAATTVAAAIASGQRGVQPRGRGRPPRRGRPARHHGYNEALHRELYGTNLDRWNARLQALLQQLMLSQQARHHADAHLHRVLENIGSVPTPASAEFIRNLPLTEFSEASAEMAENNSCSICQCDYDEGEWLTNLPCRHVYHPGCIEQWLKTKSICPLCRKDVRDAR